VIPRDVLAVVRSTLVRGLTAPQAEQLLAATVPMRVEGGKAVVREGERSMGLLILLRGTVEIVKWAPAGEDRVIASVAAPSVLGEMALLTDRPSSATVNATSDCDLRLLTRAQYQRLIEGESGAACKLVATIAEVLARRLDLMDRKVVALIERSEATAGAADLAALRAELDGEWPV
jgi:CRP-like cAMP-binding protein